MFCNQNSCVFVFSRNSSIFLCHSVHLDKCMQNNLISYFNLTVHIVVIGNFTCGDVVNNNIFPYLYFFHQTKYWKYYFFILKLPTKNWYILKNAKNRNLRPIGINLEGFHLYISVVKRSDKFKHFSKSLSKMTYV